MKKLFLPLLLMSIFLVACSKDVASTDKDLLLKTNSGKVAPMEELSFNWGDINIGGGKVEHIFKLKNDGEKDLIIKSATTSCMCTTAQVKVGDAYSLEFGMHGNSQWGYPVKPGQEFEVIVVFDPMAHGPDAVGPIQRNISLVTSSEQNGEYAKLSPQFGNQVVTEIEVEGEVLSEDEYLKKQ